MPGSAYIVASALKDPIAALRARGGDAAALCRRLGADPEVSPEARLSLRAFVGFSQAAAEQLGAPDFGWSVGAGFDLANLGAIGETIQRAPTLGAALRLFRDAFAVVQSDSTIGLAVEGDEAVLSYRILDPDIWPRDQDAELTLAVLAGLVARAAGPGWRPLELAFEHAPNGADAARAAARPCVARCRLRYRAPSNGIRFPARLLDLPLPAGDPGGFRPLARTLADQALRLESAAPLATRVRRQILRRLGQEPVDQSEVAAALGLSRRTLRRRLEAEGLLFSELLADCRIRAALRLLADRAVAIPAIAEQLGYSDATAFERAFRNRTGATPAQCRRRLRPAAGAASALHRGAG